MKKYEEEEKKQEEIYQKKQMDNINIELKISFNQKVKKNYKKQVEISYDNEALATGEIFTESSLEK